MDIRDIPRHKAENYFGYSEDDLAEKKLALEKMKIVFPTVSEYYAEMVYDMCKNTDATKIEEIKQKIETTPFKYNYENLQAELDAVKEKWEKDQPLEKVEPNERVCDASQNELISQNVEF